jgi:hypothetical protein
MRKFVKWLMAVSSVVALSGLVVGTVADDLNLGNLVGKIEVSKGRRSQSTVVYLRGVEGNYEPPQEPAVLDQKSKVFTPHLLPLQKGQADLTEILYQAH